MPAYGAPNAVGYNMDRPEPKPLPIGRTVAAAGLGGLGARSLYRAARPGADKMIERAENRPAEIQRKINREYGKKYVGHGNIANWEREKVRATTQARLIREQAPKTTKFKFRAKRAAIGAGLVATAAAVMPKRKKVAPSAPPLPPPPPVGGQ